MNINGHGNWFLGSAPYTLSPQLRRRTPEIYGQPCHHCPTTQQGFVVPGERLRHNPSLNMTPGQYLQRGMNVQPSMSEIHHANANRNIPYDIVVTPRYELPPMNYERDIALVDRGINKDLRRNERAGNRNDFHQRTCPVSMVTPQRRAEIDEYCRQESSDHNSNDYGIITNRNMNVMKRKEVQSTETDFNEKRPRFNMGFLKSTKDQGSQTEVILRGETETDNIETSAENEFLRKAMLMLDQMRSRIFVMARNFHDTLIADQVPKVMLEETQASISERKAANAVTVTESSAHNDSLYQRPANALTNSKTTVVKKNVTENPASENLFFKPNFTIVITEAPASDSLIGKRVEDVPTTNCAKEESETNCPLSNEMPRKETAHVLISGRREQNTAMNVTENVARNRNFSSLQMPVHPGSKVMSYPRRANSPPKPSDKRVKKMKHPASYRTFHETATMVSTDGSPKAQIFKTDEIHTAFYTNPKLTLRHRTLKPGLTELIAGSGIYVHAKELEKCIRASRGTKMFTRNLLPIVFSDKALRICSQRVTESKPGLDPVARDSFIAFVDDIARSKGWKISSFSVIQTISGYMKRLQRAYRIGLIRMP